MPQSGDSTPAARFETEAMPHVHDLFRIAMRMLGDRMRAEDVLQDTYLQAWKSFQRFEPGTNCKAWLCKILFHSVNHYRRRLLRFPLINPSEDVLEETVAGPPAIPDKLTDADILTALDRIPRDFRSVVLLVDVEEFAYKEASEILGVPVGTVMSRLSRGRKLLRGHLEEVAKAYGIGSKVESA